MLKKGDLVEIINISSDQISTIHSQTCRPCNPIHIIGQRYYIDRFINGKYQLQGWNHGNFMLFEESQFKVINRKPVPLSEILAYQRNKNALWR